jgi:hypothetical protein
MNVEGTVFCDTCGFELQEAAAEVKELARQARETTDDLAARATWGASHHIPTSEIIIRIRDVAEPIRVNRAPRITFGRSDGNSTIMPDVDFTPYGALESGVSRLHAMIELHDDTITIDDAGSSNGTFLNGQKIVPHQPLILRDGDEIRFGKIVANIYFK